MTKALRKTDTRADASPATKKPKKISADRAGAKAGAGMVDDFLRRINDRTAKVGVIGLGYVGLPLVHVFCERRFPVTGFDIDPVKVSKLKAGESYIKHIPSKVIAGLNASGRFDATTKFDRLAEMDAIIICVPTPLTKQREPDMTYILATGEAIAPHLRAGQLVVLESSTYPGTTVEVLKPILERGGLKSTKDFFLAYAPEREDPGNPTHSTATIPKVVGGDGADALKISVALYDQIVTHTVPVSSTETAEAIKLTENIFRAVNIALVNELKIVFTAMGIDVWEVIEAAKSKPFGFMPFYPGPGLGGHCIPIDPFYLTWKAREYEIATRFIELAGEVNTAMPKYVIQRLQDALNHRFGKPMRGAKILLMGLAYKKNVDDLRESPTLKLFELLHERGAKASYHDPFIPEIHVTREHPKLAGHKSVKLDAKTIAGFDAAIICTDHDDVNYKLLVDNCPLVVDSRNAIGRKGLGAPENVVKA
jgi:UDP-N-acetyl-D-glucosamine dehydrogenase